MTRGDYIMRHVVCRGTVCAEYARDVGPGNWPGYICVRTRDGVRCVWGEGWYVIPPSACPYTLPRC